MTTQNTRRALTGGTLAVLAVLFVAVIALANNLLRGAQIDLTQNTYDLTTTRPITFNFDLGQIS